MMQKNLSKRDRSGTIFGPVCEQSVTKKSTQSLTADEKKEIKETIEKSYADQNFFIRNKSEDITELIKSDTTEKDDFKFFPEHNFFIKKDDFENLKGKIQSQVADKESIIIKACSQFTLFKFPLIFYDKKFTNSSTAFDLNQALKKLNLSDIRLDILLKLTDFFTGNPQSVPPENLKIADDLFNFINDSKSQSVSSLFENLKKEKKDQIIKKLDVFLEKFFESNLISLEKIIQNPDHYKTETETINYIVKQISLNKISLISLSNSMKLIVRLKFIFTKYLNKKEDLDDKYKSLKTYIISPDPELQTILQKEENMKTIYSILLFPILIEINISLFCIDSLKSLIDRISIISQNESKCLYKNILKNVFKKNKSFEFIQTNLIHQLTTQIDQWKNKQKDQGSRLDTSLLEDYQFNFTESLIRILYTNGNSSDTHIEFNPLLSPNNDPYSKEISEKILTQIETKLINGLKKTWDYQLEKKQNIRYLTHLMSAIGLLTASYSLVSTKHEFKLNINLGIQILKTLLFTWALLSDQITKCLQLDKVDKNQGASSFFKKTEKDYDTQIKENLFNEIFKFSVFTSITLEVLDFVDQKNTFSLFFKLLTCLALLTRVSPRQKRLGLSYKIPLSDKLPLGPHSIILPILPFSTTATEYTQDVTRMERSPNANKIFNTLTDKSEFNLFTFTRDLIPGNSFLNFFISNNTDNLEILKLRSAVRLDFVDRVLKSDQVNALKNIEIFKEKMRLIVNALTTERANLPENLQLKPVTIHKYNCLNLIPLILKIIDDKKDKVFLKILNDPLAKDLIKDLLSFYKTNNENPFNLDPNTKQEEENLIKDIINIIDLTKNSFDPRPQTEKFAQEITDQDDPISSERIQRLLYTLATVDISGDINKSYVNSMMYINAIKDLAQNFFYLFIKNKSTIEDRLNLLNSEYLRTYPDTLIQNFARLQTSSKESKEFYNYIPSLITKHFNPPISKEEKLGNYLNKQIEIQLNQVKKLISEDEEKLQTKDAILHKKIKKIKRKAPEIPTKHPAFKSLINTLSVIQKIIEKTPEYKDKIQNINFIIGAMLEGKFSAKLLKLFIKDSNIEDESLKDIDTINEYIWRTLENLEIITTFPALKIRSTTEKLKDFKIYTISKIITDEEFKERNPELANALSDRKICSISLIKECLKKPIKQKLEIELKQKLEIESNEEVKKELIKKSKEELEEKLEEEFNNTMVFLDKNIIITENKTFKAKEKIIKDLLNIFEILQSIYITNSIETQLKLAIRPTIKSKKDQESSIENKLFKHLIKEKLINPKYKINLELEKKLESRIGKTPLLPNENWVSFINKLNISHEDYKQINIDELTPEEISVNETPEEKEEFTKNITTPEIEEDRRPNTFNIANLDTYSEITGKNLTTKKAFSSDEIRTIHKELKFEKKRNIDKLTLNDLAFRAYLILNKVDSIIKNELKESKIEIISLEPNPNPETLKKELVKIIGKFDFYKDKDKAVTYITNMLKNFSNSFNSKYSSKHSTKDLSDLRKIFLKPLKILHQEIFGIKPGLFKGLVLALTETSSASILATGLIPIPDQKNLITTAFQEIFYRINSLKTEDLKKQIKKLEEFFNTRIHILKDRSSNTKAKSELIITLLKQTKEELLNKLEKTNSTIEKYYTFITFLEKIKTITFEEIPDQINEEKKKIFETNKKEILQPIYYILTSWLSPLSLIPSSFITELFAQQSAVPIITQSGINDLKEISKELGRLKYSTNHSPNTFKSQRWENATPFNFQEEAASFGYFGSLPKNTIKRPPIGILETAFSWLEKGQNYLFPIKNIRGKNRSCLGFKIPHDELSRIFCANILKGQICTLFNVDQDHDYKPTFDVDPEIKYSIETLANTREGVLRIEEITTMNQIRLKPIKEKVETLISTKQFHKFDTLMLDLPIKDLNLNYKDIKDLHAYLKQIQFQNCESLDQLKDIKLSEIAIYQQLRT